MKKWNENMGRNNFNWDATSYFEDLTSSNRLCKSLDAKFCRVSGLEGFQEALTRFQRAKMIVAASDIAPGVLDLTNSPHIRRAKLVFMAMRHSIDSMQAREECMDLMREVFRQFMSCLIMERVQIEQNGIYIDDNVAFTEIDRYFASGMACAYFQLGITSYTNLVYNPEEWLQ